MYNDDTDKMILSKLEQNNGVIDIQYDEPASNRFSDRDNNPDSSRVYRIKFTNEGVIDDILPDEIKNIENRYPFVTVRTITPPDKQVKNTMFIRLS